MKDNKKEIEMALLDQLCKLIDSRAMEEFKPKKEVVVAVAEEPEMEDESIEMEDSEESTESSADDLEKLRKLARMKSQA